MQIWISIIQQSMITLKLDKILFIVKNNNVLKDIICKDLEWSKTISTNLKYEFPWNHSHYFIFLLIGYFKIYVQPSTLSHIVITSNVSYYDISQSLICHNKYVYKIKSNATEELNLMYNIERKGYEGKWPAFSSVLLRGL